jgi:membrane protein DedA with SNARE-associated domain
VQTMDQILSLIGQYGYLVVFFGVMLESVGVPLPGETILIAAGFLIHQGALDPGETVAFGVLGTIMGNQIGYWAARQGGRPFVLRWGRYVGVTHGHILRVEGVFARNGGRLNFGPFRSGAQGLWSFGRRYKLHALENLPLLQCSGGGGVGDGFDIGRLPL